MTEKEIRIFLRSERYEVEASLFSSDENEGDLLSLLTAMAEQGPEAFEIRSRGILREDDGRIEIQYEETEATGMAGARTSVSFMKGEPSVVTMSREGAGATTLVFESGKRYRCVYQTPYMPFEICVRTIKVENNLQGIGTLSLDYVIEIRGAKAERNKIFLQIL